MQSTGASGISWSLQMPTVNVDISEILPSASFTESPPIIPGDWWPIRSTAGCVKYLQSVSVGWKTSVVIFNVDCDNTSRMKLPTTLAIHYPLWLSPGESTSPLFSPFRTKQVGVRKDGFASTYSPRAPERQSSKALCLETYLIAHMGNLGHRGTCSRSQSKLMGEEDLGPLAWGHSPFYYTNFCDTVQMGL